MTIQPSNITTAEYIIKANFEYQVPQDTTQAGGYNYYYDSSSGNLCYEWDTDKLGAFHSLPGYTYFSGWRCGLQFNGLCNLHKRGFTRFPLTDILQGTEISNFTMSVSADGSMTHLSEIQIYVEQSDTGSTPTDNLELDALSLGSPITWTPPNFAPSTWYTTPDLSSLVQTVIDRPGWVDNGHITIVFRCDGISRYIRSWFGASYEAGYRPKVNLTVTV